MPTAMIQLAFRQVIDASSQSTFEKNVLRLSYEEYKMKSQAYSSDDAITSFTDLKAKDGRANSLHYKSGFAIGGLIDGLNKKIPVLRDILGQQVEFDTHKFEVIESDINHQQVHKVAIHYITDWFTIYKVIGDNLLLSKQKENEADQDKPVETFMLRMEPDLSIVSYQELPVLERLN